MALEKDWWSALPRRVLYDLSHCVQFLLISHLVKVSNRAIIHYCYHHCFCDSNIFVASHLA